MRTLLAKSDIRDASLADAGMRKIEWASAHMPVLRHIHDQFQQSKPFSGMRVAISLHLEAKTAYLGLVIQAGGAQVIMTGSNPLSTQDDVCAALVASGVVVYAMHNPTEQQYIASHHRALDAYPDLIIDDGGDLVALLHTTRTDALAHVRGGAEETTTGMMRLRALGKQLRFPMVAVNDAQCKYLFDNRYGTGQSVFDAINRTTNLVISGKTVVVVGYGWCGKGVAMRASGLGAHVIVTEIDPIKAIEAVMDGYAVMPMSDAVAQGDVFVTVTGNRDVITTAHMMGMKHGAILANAGHFDIEIDVASLRTIASVRTVRPLIDAYTLPNGKVVYVLADGRLVNLAAGDGHPVEIMDMTFALQALALQYVHEAHAALPREIVALPRAVDERVARYKLSTLGIAIDALTDVQKAYYAGALHDACQ
ncbi:MAG: adenosylhomocysteinase [Paenibacillaceae bacterium]|jgi:adenosylhomocysteinase|nr:adenosylhomocysteinase [Paenibacillaceae bacterium]